MNVSCIVFGVLNLKDEEARGKHVLEVDSYNVNGSLRPIIERLVSAKYIGVDIEIGPGVDMICNADNLINFFSSNSFD